MNGVSILFDPAFPWPVLAALALAALVLVAFAAWRGLTGWVVRGLGVAAILLALSGPSLQREDRMPLGDVLLAVVDRSASQGLASRPAQTDAALQALSARVARSEGVDLHLVEVGDGEDNRGTRILTALSEALADLPRDRIAGVVVISDGQAHDLPAAPDLPAPLHLLLTGQTDDWDRRLVIDNAPAFAILGEEQEIVLHIEDQGAASGNAARTTLEISVDGGAPITHEVPIGVELRLPVTLTHGGQNVIHLSTPLIDGELTDRNNAAIVQMSGVRDRLRVLLVSGEPNPGTRTWRNLLKSDASVDLVHFTILRPPNKQDGVPVSELSLIAFPTQELFMDKVDEFDLIIFDRYKLRGILPSQYLASVRDYVTGGGAVLVAAGPDFATAESLARSPLGDILPALPTSRVIEQGYLPAVTALGARHPVTRGLEAFAPDDGWGRWFRLIELEPAGGQVVMAGLDAPLLALDRVGEGRVALLGSDHAWLWSRGVEGGGPQLELLRRLAHWMMKEPELEEEALSALAENSRLVVTRRTMGEGERIATVTTPDGATLPVPLEEASPGLYRGQVEAPALGLYRLEEGGVTAVIALGPSAPKEFEETIATDAVLGDVVSATGGGVLRLSDGMPGLRAVREGRVAAGRGWIGYTPRGAYLTQDVRIVPLAPPWLMLLIAAGLALAAWLWEGRGRRAPQP
ncbi:hypothetical protein [Aliiroseovarius subalbicans]|uniref:hypothetical protein n=1 Tax=Aliiroseovarius subalbicans TaxID=2925840 RepID=UPI001F5A9B36|nr:hypothetical protein [Aliiroseovarius subalbicans]MCI2400728.1 hypothetical protein [Aliiroseovarius subalbicans]